MVQRIGFGGNTIEFPDEFSQEQIDQIIKQRAPEYRKMFGISEPEAPSYASDLYQSAKKGAGSGISGLGWLADKATGYGSSLQDYGGAMAKAAEAEISPLAKERASRDYLLEAAPGEGMFGYKPNFSALAGAPYQIAESLPGSLAGMGAAAAATAAVPVGVIGATGAAGIAALRLLGPLGTKLATSALGRAGTSAAVATGKDIFEAASPAVGRMITATLAGSTTEGLQAAGMSGEEIEKTITQYLTADPSALNRDPIGKAALAQANGNVAEAIKIAAAESAGKAALKTGLATAGLSLPGSIFEAGIITGTGRRGAVRQALTGGLTEGVLQEMPQSASEQYIQNVAQGAYDPSVAPSEGVLEAAIKGGIAGFGMGAGLGGVSAAVQGAEPNMEDLDRMGRRVGQEELGGALEDVRRQDINHVDMLKAQGIGDDEIVANYPHLADELANRRATEAVAAQQEADDFAANRDQISEGGPSFGDFSVRSAGVSSFVDSTFSFDNPATKRGDVSWMEGKQRRAEQDMQERPDNTLQGKGIAGSVTGWNETPVELPTSMLADVQGASNERRVPGDPKYDSLVESVEKNGWNPTPIKVRVSHQGVPYIVEGNTRAAVARDMGFPTIPAQIEWMNGAELSDSQWSPQGVSEGVLSAAPAEEEFSTRTSGPSLPKDLSGAKPNYGFDNKNFKLNFESDTGKALYIASGKPASNPYRQWLVNEAGVPDESINNLGKQIRNQIKGIASSQPAGSPISVTNSFFETPSANAPKAAKPIVQPEIDEAAPLDENAFEEEFAPSAAPQQAAGAAIEPLDPERLRRSHDIVGTFLNQMATRGPSGKTQAATAARQIADGALSSPEVHHALIANDIVSRILGGTQADPDTGFFKDLTRDYDARRIGVGKPGGGLKGLIEFSLNPGSLSYMRETAYHEPFHILQDLMQQYDPKTAQLVAGKFNDGMTLDQIDPSIRRTLQMASSEKGGPTYWDKFSEQYQAATPAGETLRSEFGKAREAQAYMFGMLADAKAQGHNMNGLTPAFKRFLNFLAQVRQRMGNYLRGQGYRSVQDVFHDYASGKGQQGYGAEVSGAAPEGEEYSFVGKGSKNWSKAVQDKAEELEEQDVNPIDIYKQTGLHRGLRDRKWRAEVPDVYASFNPSGLAKLAKKGAKVELQELYDHAELYENYPWIGYIDVKGMPIPEGEAAYYAFQRLIEVSSVDVAMAGKGLETGLKRSIVHEVQHAIQMSEGFSPGASPDKKLKSNVFDSIERYVGDIKAEMKQSIVKPMKDITGVDFDSDWMDQVEERIAEVANEYNVNIYENGYFTRAVSHAFPNVSEKVKEKILRDGIVVWDKFLNAPATKDIRDDVMAALMSDKRMAGTSKVLKVAREFYNDLDDKFEKWQAAFKKDKTATFELYEGEPGERESRDTEDRLKLTSDEERRATLPGAFDTSYPVKAEGKLGEVLNEQKYLRQWMGKLKEAIDKSVPEPEEFEVLSDYVDEFSKRGGANAPQTAGVNPFPIPPQNEIDGRMRRAENRRSKYVAGISNGPKNKRVELRNAPEKGETVGKVSWVIGKITPRDWVNRVEANLNDSDIAEARDWYPQAMRAYSQYFGEDWPKYLASWLMANQQASPATAQMNAIRAREKVLGGTISGPRAGLAHDRLMPFWEAMENGGSLPLGGAQKLYDFIDSGLLRDTRSWMGNDPAAGAPAVADVHSLRDAGYVDETLHKVLVDKYGDQAANIPVDIGGSPSESQYEMSADFLRDVTDYLNDENYKGGNWTPADVQAVGWMSTSKFTGNQGQTPLEAITRNIRDLNYELGFGEGAPYNDKFPKLAQLPTAAQKEVVGEVLNAVTDFATSLTGVKEIGRVQGTGGWLSDNVEQNMRLQTIASPEAMIDTANIIGWITQQTGMLPYRLLPGRGAQGAKFAIRISSTGGNSLASDEAMGTLWQKLRKANLKKSNAKGADPIIQGYSTHEENGNPAMVIMFDGGGDRLLERITSGDIAQAIQKVSDEMGSDLKVGVLHHENDYQQNNWKEDKDGEGYLRGLRERYGPDIQKKLRDYQRSEFEPQLGRAIETAEAKYGLKPSAPEELSKRGGVDEKKKNWPSNQWIEGMYEENMPFPYGGERQFAIGFDPNEKDEVTSFVTAAMQPLKNDTAYISWFQAYPNRSGVGTRGLKEILNSASENGIKVALDPWTKGGVSKAALTRFYKKNGFKEEEGSKRLIFDPTTQGSELSKRGGVDEGEKAIGRAVQVAHTKAVTGWGKVTRFLKSTFDPLAELPEREQYLLKRYALLGKTDALEDEAKGFYEVIKKATDLQKKQIYAYFTTRGAVAPVLPPELQAVVLKVKARINQIGNELLGRKIISPQSLAVYKDKYLPRLYMKYLLEEKGIAGTGIGVGNQNYKLERNQKLSAEERIAMGEVVDPGFLSFAALYRPARDMAVLDFLDQVATTSGTDWVMKDQLVNWKGSKVTAFWLSDESKNIRERILYEPDARKRAVMERVANQMQALADPLLNTLTTENYKRLPTSNRYGALKGLAVRKEIYNDLIAAGGFDPDPNFIDKVFGDKNSYLARGTQFWKMSKTVLNLPTQARNFMSNVVMLNLSGVPLHMLSKRMMQAMDAMRNNGLAWQIAKQYGVRAGGFNENELRDAQQVLREYLSQNTTGFMNPRHITNFLASLADKAGNVYQLTDMLFKTAKIVDEIERKGIAGMPAGAARTKAEGQAALEGHKWFFDYSLVPRGIKSLRTMPFGAPFITYAYKALPLIVEVATNPKTAMRFAPYIALQAVLPLLVASMEDVDEEDIEKLKMSMSEQLREKPNMLLIPFRDQLNRWQFLDAGYFFPWSMFLQTALKLSKGDVMGAVSTVGALTSPALSVVAALKTNIDPFTGREIINPLDPPRQQMFSMLNYANGIISPPMLTSYGVLGKTIDAATNTGMNKYGEPNLTATQIGLRAIGVNITPLVPEMQRARNLNYMESQYRKVEGLRALRLKDASLTDEEAEEISNDFDEKLKDLWEKMEKYAEESDFPAKLQTNK